MSLHNLNPRYARSRCPWPLRTRSGEILVCCIAIALFLGATGCRAVKPYQRKYLNDYNMRLGKADIEKFDESVHTYREAASGGGNGKASGGCGCN